MQKLEDSVAFSVSNTDISFFSCVFYHIKFNVFVHLKNLKIFKDITLNFEEKREEIIP